MAHILLQCQVDNHAVNVLNEMGLATEEQFLHFPDCLEEFQDKVTSPNIDHLVVAAMWMKENADMPSILYESEFTDELLTSRLKALHDKRAKEQLEKEKKDIAQWKHILSLCGMKDDGRDRLNHCKVTSLKDLLALPKPIKDIKHHWDRWDANGTKISEWRKV